MFILYSGSVASVAIDASTKTFSLTSTASSTLTVGSGTYNVFRIFWDTTQSKLLLVKSANSGGNGNEYQYISESSGTLTASSSVNDSNSTQFHQIEYHPGLSTYFGFRWQFVRTGNEDRYYPYFTPITVGTSAFTYGTEVQAPIYLSQYDAYNQHSGSGDMRFIPSKTGNSVSLYHLMRIAASGAESQGREHFAFGTLNSSGTYTSSSGFSSMIGVNSGDQAGTGAHKFGTSIDRDGYAYVSYPISYTTTKVASTLIRTASVSTAADYLGIAQNAAADGGSVTVMLAGGISTGHSSLTQDVKYYVQNDGSLATTSTSTVAGHSVSTDSIQVADSQGTFSTSTAFADLTSTPTTLSGYGITDALSNAGNVDIGSSDFITTGKSYYANMFSALSDLPSATTYHGMFAHVHATGAGYFAHGGNWIELANKSYVDTEVAGIVDSAPGTLNTLNELAAALNDDANFATTVTNSLALKAPLASPALTGTPTAPTASSGTNTTQVATTAFVQSAVSGAGSYNDAAVDTHLNTGTASTNEVLSWNGSDYDWVAQSGGGGASVTTSDAAPSSPSAGDLWYNTNAGGLFVYYQDANSAQWVEIVGKTGATGAQGPAGSSVITRYANLAGFPGSPTAADLAYANDTNTLYLYNGTSWEVVASGNDESPVITTEPPTSTQALSNSGSTSTVTMVAQDPEGFDVTYGIAYKTTGNARPTQLSADTTINQSTGVYTFTPSTNQAHAGNFRARLSASDGARTTTRLVDFSLAFAATVDYLVVAGGGAGGGTTNGAGEGGGGAGGLIYATGQTFSAGVTFGITVGAGGTAGTGQGGDGGNSVISGTGFTTVTAIGGGGGGSSSGGVAGRAGGSGGGGSYNSGAGGAGTSGQGNAGGTANGGNGYPAGGGGGAGAAGSTSQQGSHGGDGLEYSITGTATYYAGGGGGGSRNTPGTGGQGGGGNGSGGNGTANTGGGGGGATNENTAVGSGGSGVVILRTTSTASATTGSPTVTQDGSYNVYKFTADGSITF